MARSFRDGLSERGRYWLRLMSAWERSGLTQTAFCRQQGVKHVTFCWWKRQLAGREDPSRGVRTRAPAVPRGAWASRCRTFAALTRARAARPSSAAGARRRGGSAKAIFAPVRIRADEPAGRDEPNADDRPSITGGRIEIMLDGGRRIRLRGPVDRHALAEVLAVLDPGHATGAGTFNGGDDAMRVRGEAPAC